MLFEDFFLWNSKEKKNNKLSIHANIYLSIFIVGSFVID